MLAVGRPAPSFTLPDHDGKPVSLASLRGRTVVLYFYPKDDTPGCTVEACEFTANLKTFEGLDAVVYGCSPDGAASHRKFISKFSLKVGLLSDSDLSTLKAYGAYGEKNFNGKTVMGVLRSTALIGPDGALVAHWPAVKAEGHAAEVAAKIAELRKARPVGAKSESKLKGKIKAMAKVKGKTLAKAKAAVRAMAKGMAKAMAMPTTKTVVKPVAKPAASKSKSAPVAAKKRPAAKQAAPKAKPAKPAAKKAARPAVKKVRKTVRR